jgi:hypothetical protein
MHPRGAHSQQPDHAFTLAEVMMATVVLLIAIVGLFEAVTIGAGMLNVSRKQSIALQIIRTEIESVHLTVWPSGGPPDGSIMNVPVDTSGYPELMSLKSVGKGFTISRTVVTIRSAPNWLKKISFIVTWSESTGRFYTRTGYTYCAKNGINALYQR